MVPPGQGVRGRFGGKRLLQGRSGAAAPGDVLAAPQGRARALASHVNGPWEGFP